MDGKIMFVVSLVGNFLSGLACSDLRRLCRIFKTVKVSDVQVFRLLK